MNLHDVAPIIQETEEPSGADVAAAMKANAARAALEDVLAETELAEKTKKAAGVVDAGLFEFFGAARQRVVNRTGTLPKALRYEKNDALSEIADTPRSLLSGLREVADKLGLVIVPFEYLDERAFSGENALTQKSIDGFVAAQGAIDQRVYAMCPIGFYSVGKHVAAMDDVALYGGSAFAQSLAAINMVIPMFRGMAEQLEGVRGWVGAVEERVTAMDGRVKSVEGKQEKLTKEVANLSRRVDELGAAVEQQRKQAIEAAAVAAAQAEQLAHWRAEERQARREARFIAQDPLLLGVPKDTHIALDDGWAHVGPCWGEDFADIVVELSGLQSVPGQRAELTKRGKRWGR